MPRCLLQTMARPRTSFVLCLGLLLALLASLSQAFLAPTATRSSPLSGE